MRLRYVVTVADFGVMGQYMATVRQRRFRNLAFARRYELKFYKKAMRAPNRKGRIENWGSGVHFVNNGNFAEVRTNDNFYNPVRTITITCENA